MIRIVKEDKVYRFYENEKEIGFAVESSDIGSVHDLYI